MAQLALRPAALAVSLARVSRAQGLLLGRLADVGLGLRDQASLHALTDDVINTSEIEGEHLNAASVAEPALIRAGFAKCSPDTALRDINELVQASVLQRSPAGGRSTSYELMAFKC